MAAFQSNATAPNENSPLAAILLVLFFVGLGLMIAAMSLYDDVAMPLRTALLLWIVPGVIATPLMFNSLPSKKLKGVGKAFILLVLNVAAFGGILLYGVLAVDFYQSKGSPVSTHNFPIVGSGLLGDKGRFAPYADIIYKNNPKRFQFSSDSGTIANKYHYIRLETTPGCLGFDVIKNYKLLK